MSDEMDAATYRRKVQRAPEGQLVDAVIRYLWLKGCFVWRNNTGQYDAEYQGKTRHIRFGLPGSADVLGVAPDGRFVGVECKTERGRLSDKQRDFLAAVTARGGIALVVRPGDYAEQIDAALVGEGE